MTAVGVQRNLDKDASDVNTLLDRKHDLNERFAALDRLVTANPAGAVPVLLHIGGRTDEPDALLKRVGEALAALHHSGVHVRQFDMRDLSEPANEGFLDWMPPKEQG